MPNDAQEWDERYRQPGHWAGTDPAEFLIQVLPLLPRGLVLDIASGEGHNALFLAAQEFQVFAVERSHVALEKCEASAQERGLPVRWASKLSALHLHASGLTLLEADLDALALPAAQFDVILCFKYLQRSLLPNLSRALRPHGVLVYETYTQAHRQFAGGPRNPDFLLRPGELRAAFSGMEILFYSELCAGKGMASLLARKA